MRKAGSTTVPCALLLLASIASFTPSAWGSPHGFREFIKHEQTQPLVLPPLHEPIPAHVPVLSNAALIRLWQTNQFSPILRDPSIEKQLCEAVTEKRDLNPLRFDRNHPTLGRLLSDRTFFAYALHQYTTHPARFVHYHHHLIPIIRGCVLMQAAEGQVIQGPGAGSPNIIPVPEGIQVGPTPTPTTPQLETLSVPAPQGLLLLCLGLACIAPMVTLRRHITPI